MISNNVDLSILVTFCNQRKYIHEVLDSIFEQKTSYTYEVLVLIDGEEDGSSAIVEGYQERYPNLYLFRIDHDKDELPLFRASYNRMHLLKQAKGRYFCTLDGDDKFISDTRFEAGLSFLEREQEYIGHACARRLYNEKKGTYVDSRINSQSISKDNYKSKDDFYIHVSQNIFRNIFLSGEHYFNDRHFDDAVLFYFMLTKGNVYFENEVMFLYRVGIDSIYQSQKQLYKTLVHIININAMLSISDEFKYKKRLLSNIKNAAVMSGDFAIPESLKKAAKKYHIPHIIDLVNIEEANSFKKVMLKFALNMKLLSASFRVFCCDFLQNEDRKIMLCQKKVHGDKRISLFGIPLYSSTKVMNIRRRCILGVPFLTYRYFPSCKAVSFLGIPVLYKYEGGTYAKHVCAWYKRMMKVELPLEAPRTFNEKIQWMKLYDSTPIKTLLADKYLARDWVAERIGSKYLIPLIGAYDSFDEIDFDSLPTRFVIKCNHGCAYNIIVKDKDQLDKEDARKKIEGWMKENFAFKAGCELHYKNIPPKIIIEEFIENKNAGDLYDYKFWCFDGEVKYIQFSSDREGGTPKIAFYDVAWVKQTFRHTFPLDTKEREKPDNLNEMIALAKTLSQGFNYVRVDFYRMDDGTLYFGEMTFTSMSGTARWSDEKIHRQLGDWIKLPSKAYDVDSGEYYDFVWPHQKMLVLVKRQNFRSVMIYGRSIFSVEKGVGKKIVRLFGLPLFNRTENEHAKKLSIFGVQVLKKVKAGDKKRISIFGIPIFKKITTAGKKRLSVLGVPVYSVKKKGASVIRRILFLRYKSTNRQQ